MVDIQSQAYDLPCFSAGTVPLSNRLPHCIPSQHPQPRHRGEGAGDDTVQNILASTLLGEAGRRRQLKAAPAHNASADENVGSGWMDGYVDTSR